jgi:hypothetical protein
MGIDETSTDSATTLLRGGACTVVLATVREAGPVYERMLRRATCAGAAGSHPASEEGKLELTEALRSFPRPQLKEFQKASASPGCEKTVFAPCSRYRYRGLRRQRTAAQDAQKGRPARPQRAKRESYSVPYVEPLSDARTTLADFFSILLERRGRGDARGAEARGRMYPLPAHLSAEVYTGRTISTVADVG